MMALGGYGLIVDRYGSTNPARRFHLNTTEVIARYLGSCFSASCPFHMAIMEDKGAFSSQCPKGKKDHTSCIVKNLNRDMDYINSQDRKSTRLNSSHRTISYAVFCLKKKKKQ